MPSDTDGLAHVVTEMYELYPLYNGQRCPIESSNFIGPDLYFAADKYTYCLSTQLYSLNFPMQEKMGLITDSIGQI